MTFHPERYVGLGLLFLMIAVAGFAVLDKWRVRHLPPAVNTAIEKIFPGAEASSVAKYFKNGRCLFDVRVVKDGATHRIRIDERGRVLDVEPSP